MKLTKAKIKKLIQEAVSSILTVPNLTKRSLPHDVQQEPIPPEFQMQIPDHERFDKLKDLRRRGLEGDALSGTQADSLYKSFTDIFGPDYDMTSKGYSKSKSAYDKAADERDFWDGGEGVMSLDPQISSEFSSLGEYLEYNEHPVHGSQRDTILYKTYEDVMGRDIVRAIKILEDYLTNPSKEYVEDREKIEPSTLAFLKHTIQDMKDEKSASFNRYFGD